MQQITDNIQENSNEKGENILHQATKYETHKETFDNLLKALRNKPDLLKILLHEKDIDGNTPLNNAIIYGNSFILKSILNECSELQILDNILENPNKKGLNLLHLATLKKIDDESFDHLLNVLRTKPDLLKILLHGIDPDGKTPFNNTVIYGNLIQFKSMLELCKELQILDNILKISNDKGSNLLHLSTNCFTDIETFDHLLNILRNKTDLLKKLLHQKDIDGNTPINNAVIYGTSTQMKSILEMCDELQVLNDVLDISNENGENILHLANTNEFNDEIFDDMLHLLITKPDLLKKLLNKKDCDGYTPLNDAVVCGKYSQLKSMLKVYYELQIVDDFIESSNGKGENILHQAILNEIADETFDYLLDLLKTKPDLLKKILREKDGHGDTPINNAVIYGNSIKLKSLLKVYSDLQIADDIFESSNEKCENILHLAIVNEMDDESFDHLLKFLATEWELLKILLDEKNINGDTPVEVAKLSRQSTKLKNIFETIERKKSVTTKK